MNRSPTPNSGHAIKTEARGHDENEPCSAGDGTRGAPTWVRLARAILALLLAGIAICFALCRNRTSSEIDHPLDPMRHRLRTARSIFHQNPQP